MNAPPGIIKSAAKTLGDGAGLNPDLAPGGGGPNVEKLD